MGFSTIENALIEKIAKNLFLEGLIQAEQQANAIKIIKELTDSDSCPNTR